MPSGEDRFTKQQLKAHSAFQGHHRQLRRGVLTATTPNSSFSSPVLSVWDVPLRKSECCAVPVWGGMHPVLPAEGHSVPRPCPQQWVLLFSLTLDGFFNFIFGTPWVSDFISSFMDNTWGNDFIITQCGLGEKTLLLYFPSFSTRLTHQILLPWGSQIPLAFEGAHVRALLYSGGSFSFQGFAVYLAKPGLSKTRFKNDQQGVRVREEKCASK